MDYSSTDDAESNNQGQPFLFVHKSGLENISKIISAKGVNAAYLDPGESCFSIYHSTCALVVLSNGTRSFVAHLMDPYDPELPAALLRIKQEMGGEVTAKLYQRSIRKHGIAKKIKEELHTYVSILESVVGKDNVTKKCGYGNYFITADGNVENITDARRIELQQTYVSGKNIEFVCLDQQRSPGAMPITEHPRFDGYAIHQNIPATHVQKGTLLGFTAFELNVNKKT